MSQKYRSCGLKSLTIVFKLFEYIELFTYEATHILQIETIHYNNEYFNTNNLIL